MDSKDTTTPNEVSEDALQDMTVTSTGDMEKVAEAVDESMPKPPESVMDVSPPPQDDVVVAPVVAEPTPEEAPEATDTLSAAPSEPVTPMPQEQVILPTGADPVSSAMDHEAKKTGKGLIVAIAVVLALVLASIALLVFMKANKTAKSSDSSAPAPSSQTTTEAPKAAPVTASDIDAVTSDVDATLGALDEDKDFSADSLSDKTLGLQ